MAKNDKQPPDYTDTFMEEQQRQYVPWRYISEGRPQPLDEAKGNARLYGIFFIVGGIVFILLGIFIAVMVCSVISTSMCPGQAPVTRIHFTFNAASFFPPLLLLGAPGGLFVLVGRRYMQRHAAKKEAMKKQNTARRARKKKR